MLSRSNIHILFIPVCLLLALVVAFYHGGRGSLLTMGIATFMILLIGLIQAFITISFTEVDSDGSNNDKTQSIIPSLVCGGFLSLFIVGFNSDLGFLKAVSSVFFDPSVYTYHAFVSINLIYVFCGLILLLSVLSTYIVKTSKTLPLFITITVFLYIISSVPQFYRLNIALTGMWALWCYMAFSSLKFLLKNKLNAFESTTRSISVVFLGVLTAFYFSANWLIISLALIAGCFAGQYVSENLQSALVSRKFLKHATTGVISLITIGYLIAVWGVALPKMVVALLCIAVLVFGVFQSRKTD